MSIFFLSMLDFDDNQERNIQALSRLQHDSKLQKEIASITSDCISQNRWDEFQHKLLMSQYPKKECPKNMCRVLLSVFHKTGNHQSSLGLPKEVSLFSLYGILYIFLGFFPIHKFLISSFNLFFSIM